VKASFLKCFVILLFLSISFVNAEYCIYKLSEDGDRHQISQDVHSKVYDVLMRYQFPMSARYSLSLKKSLSNEDLDFLCKDERGFLEKKVQEIEGSLRVEQIPTVLYELSFLNRYLDDLVSKFRSGEMVPSSKPFRLYAHKSVCSFDVPDEMKSLLDDSDNTISLIRKHSSTKQISKGEGTRASDEALYITLYRTARKSHYEFNNYLVDKLGSLDSSDLLRDLFQKSKEYQGIKKPNLSPQLFPQTFLRHKSKDLSGLVEAAVDVETRAADEGKHAIYRGTMGYADRLDRVVKNTVSRGLSFGPSVFSGVFLSSATMPFKFMNVYDIGYSVLVDRRSFFDETSFERKFISIPPWPTVINLVAYGAFTHPRMAISEDYLDFPEEAEELFQNYLRENAVIIKNESKTTSENLLSSFVTKSSTDTESEELYISEWDHFFELDKGRFYRSKLLSARRLTFFINKFGLKTVINLCGEEPNRRWWRSERHVCEKNGVEFYNISMSAERLPYKKDVLALLDIYNTAPKPIMVHCARGIDRTGEAAALWLLEKQGKSKKEALDQLSSRYNHNPRTHPTKTQFIRIWNGYDWLLNEYDPEECSEITLA
jgi:protein tyrosine phosphatase (PTP) superfamily phosphohydrolase (DUF442 family)